MRPAIDAVLATGTTVAEVALCYTADLLDPNEKLYTLDYYLRLAEQIVESGAHILAVKDMAGLLRAEAAATLVTALRERFDLPVHVHTHDTAGGQLATLLAAARAGADAVDVASAPMAGTTSQPSASALVAALAHTERDTGISLQAVSDLEPYWEAVRHVYKPFESGLPGPTGRVYKHEIPGGQLSNLRQQAIALGLADQFEKIEDLYAAANRILGRPPKVTPSSKVVGDLALALAAANADPDDFEQNPDKYDVPDSVIGFMAGELGELPGGWPEPFRTKVLKGRTVKIGVEPISAEDAAALDGDSHGRRAALNRLLFAAPTQIFLDGREQYGDLSTLRTIDYLYGLKQGVGTRRRHREGREPVRRARGDRRGRRQGHAHRHVDAQRAASPGVRSRSVHQGRQHRRGEGRPDQTGSRRRAVLGRGHASGRGGCCRRGRPERGIHRGHEDGGGDHRDHLGHGSPTRDPRNSAGGCGRSAAGHRVISASGAR